MKTFFDLQITIPEGRKPGKYLQKTYNNINDLSSLVRSLDYCPVEFETKDDFLLALTYCHSCQSKGNAPDLYYQVYSTLPNIKLIGLLKADKPTARVLINTKTSTFTRIYGPKHFLLKERLLYAGYKEGSITDVKEISPLLETVIEPSCPISKFPKSLKKVKQFIFTYPSKPRYSKDLPFWSLIRYKELLEECINEIPEQALISNPKLKEELETRIEKIDFANDWIERNDKLHNEYNQRKRKYDKAYRKWNHKINCFGIEREYLLKDKNPEQMNHDIEYKNPFVVEHTYLSPIKFDYAKISSDDIDYYETSLFLDSIKEFVHGKVIRKAGWYLNDWYSKV
jgi:hypothetical protein